MNSIDFTGFRWRGLLFPDIYEGISNSRKERLMKLLNFYEVPDYPLKAPKKSHFS